MIVNSITFLIFFSIVFILYYAGQKVLKWQQYILLVTILFSALTRMFPKPTFAP